MTAKTTHVRSLSDSPHELLHIATALSSFNYNPLAQRGSIVSDLDATILTANHTALNFMGYQEEEVINHSLVEFLAAESQDRVKLWLESDGKAVIVCGSMVLLAAKLKIRLKTKEANYRVVSVWLKRKVNMEGRNILIWIISEINQLAVNLSIKDGFVLIFYKSLGEFYDW